MFDVQGPGFNSSGNTTLRRPRSPATTDLGHQYLGTQAGPRETGGLSRQGCGYLCAMTDHARILEEWQQWVIECREAVMYGHQMPDPPPESFLRALHPSFRSLQLRQ